jgi:hypothetical protein
MSSVRIDGCHSALYAAYWNDRIIPATSRSAERFSFRR